MSYAGWFIVLLALVSANLPFLNHRLFACVPLRCGTVAGRKPFFWRLAELLLLYVLIGVLAAFLEARNGNRFVQGWQFYVVTLCLFVVFAFPGFTYQYLVKRR